MGELKLLAPIKRSTLTAQETAVYLGISLDSVYMLVREKRVPHFKVGRRILFKKDAIDKWIESQMEQLTIGVEER